MAGSKDELLAQLEGYADPVARMLRAATTDRGTLDGDFRLVLDGVGSELGCDGSTEKSFVVLSNQDYVPKPILTRCANDAASASQFFMAMVGTPDGLDPRTVHLASWDADAGVYRRYATAPTPDGEMTVNVAPEFCLGCHGGPPGAATLGTWVPRMNEMASPWSNWNAHPGFSSQLFDEHLDPAFAADPTYVAVTRDGVLDSAAAFEPIARAGMNRVTGARLKTRLGAADVAAASELVQPLFCDDSVNYVSEVHTSGELRTAAVVDDAIRQLYRSADIDGSWGWLVDSRIQLPPPTGTEQPVTLIPVRGETTIQVEVGLVTRGVLDPRAVLRVRALDWKHPVASSYRCNLFHDAASRIAAIDLAGADTVEQLVPRVLDAILSPYAPGAGFDVLALPDAAVDAPTAATLVELATAIDAHVTSTQRGSLAAERDRRACAVAKDPTAPIYDVQCP
jgi:hypothetical protein